MTLQKYIFTQENSFFVTTEGIFLTANEKFNTETNSEKLYETITEFRLPINIILSIYNKMYFGMIIPYVYRQQEGKHYDIIFDEWQQVNKIGSGLGDITLSGYYLLSKTLLSNPKIIGEIDFTVPSGKDGFHYWTVSEYGENLSTGGGWISAGASVPWGGIYSLATRINFSKSDYIEEFGNITVSGSFGISKNFDVTRKVTFTGNKGYYYPYEFRLTQSQFDLHIIFDVEKRFLYKKFTYSIGCWSYFFQSVGTIKSYTDYAGIGWRELANNINFFLLAPYLKLASYKNFNIKLLFPSIIWGRDSYKSSGIWLSVSYGMFM